MRNGTRHAQRLFLFPIRKIALPRLAADPNSDPSNPTFLAIFRPSTPLPPATSPLALPLSGWAAEFRARGVRPRPPIPERASLALAPALMASADQGAAVSPRIGGPGGRTWQEPPCLKRQRAAPLRPSPLAP